MNQKLRDLLYRSFDEYIPPDKQRLLEKALSESPDLQKEKKQIEKIRNRIKESGSQTFSPHFVNRTIDKISSLELDKKSPELFFDSMLVTFRRVAIAVCIAIITVFSYQMIKNKTISLDRVIGLSKLDSEDMVDLALIKLDEILDLPLDLDLEKEL